jgi:T5SS/PEP-CTERM-associated repeat protein
MSRFHVVCCALAARGGACWSLFLAATLLAFPCSARAAITPAGDVSSAWNINASDYVGQTSSGTMTVDGGSSLMSGYCYLGYGVGASGRMVVSGSGSTWNNRNDSYIGYLGGGTLSIDQGGSVTSSMPLGYATYVGWGEDSTGLVEFGAGGGTLTTCGLFASPSQLQGTGLINARGLVSDIDLVFDASHGLTQTILSEQSSGTVTISLDLSNTSYNGALGAGWKDAGSLTIQKGSVQSSSGYLGYASSATGSATVDGTGSYWQMRQGLNVGYFGGGTLSITNHGVVRSGWVGTNDSYIGYGAGSNGAVQVDGTGSLLSVGLSAGSNLFVGNLGSGHLSITNGGKVSVTGATFVGADAGSISSIDFGATGGTLTTQALLASPTQLSGNGKIIVKGLVSDVDLRFDSSHPLSQAFQFPNDSGTVTVSLDMSVAANNGSLGAGWRGDGTLTIQNGSVVQSADGLIGYCRGASGAATVSGAGSTWVNTSGLYVGNAGSGTLSITSGGSVSIGGNSGTSITRGSLCVGNFRTGLLSITSGGTLTSKTGVVSVAAAPGSSGTVTVDGAGSTWSYTNPLLFGGNVDFTSGAYTPGGNATLSITNGGKLVRSDNSYSPWEVSLGSSAGSTGAATVDGAGSIWNNGGAVTISVGRGGGSGTLSITNGGSVTSGLCVGNADGASGLVSIDGQGSTFSTSGNYIAVGLHNASGTISITRGGTFIASYYEPLYIGAQAGSSGSVSVDGAGSLCSGFYISVGYGANGTLSVSNGGSVSAPMLMVGDGGTGSGIVSITHGGSVTGGYGYLGYDAAFSGVVTIADSGSTWTVGEDFRVGDSGSGTLSIINGGAATGTNGRIAVSSGSRGVATVDGAGSTWKIDGLYLDGAGSATLSISNGASVSAKTTYIGDAAGLGTVGLTTGGGTLSTQTLFLSPSHLTGSGAINARGLVSDLDVKFDTDHGLKQVIPLQQSAQGIAINLDMSGESGSVGPLGVGYYAAGSLTIRDGVSVTSSSGYVAYNDGSTGVATVTGNGSAWTVNEALLIGYGGSGTLTITDGGRVSAANGCLVACSAGKKGAVVVNGDGSTWQTDFVEIGASGEGSLSITGGGSVTSVNGVIGESPNSIGVVTVDGAGSTWTINDPRGNADPGSLDVGYDGAATLAISNGGRVSVAGATYVGCDAQSTGTIRFGPNGGTLDTQSLLASPAQLAGTGTINARGLVSNINLILDSPESLTQSLPFQQDGQHVTVNLDLRGDAGAMGAGWHGSGSLTVCGGTALRTSAGYVGYGNGATGTAAVSESGSTWTSATGLDVGYLGGSGTLSISDGGAVNCASYSHIGVGSGAKGLVTLRGAGSTWTNAGNVYVGGSSASGTLSISGGGRMSIVNDGYGCGSICVGYDSYSSSSGFVNVDGSGSALAASYSAFVGGSSSSGTLSITGGGSVTAWDATISTCGLVSIDVGRGSLLAVGRNSTLTNNGRIRLLAGAGVPEDNSLKYSPISAYTWSGTGLYQAIGGTWNATNHQFTASSITSGTSGSPVSLDLASVQRALITYHGPDDVKWTVGASLAAASSTSNATLTATAISDSILDSLKLTAGDSQDVLGGWTFSTTGYTVSYSDPVYLSFDVGTDSLVEQLHVWHYDGSTWTRFATMDLTYDGKYASFTATGLSGYAVTVPEPTAAALLITATLGLLSLARRKRRIAKQE